MIEKSDDDKGKEPSGKAFAKEYGLPYIEFSFRPARTRAEGAMNDVHWNIAEFDEGRFHEQYVNDEITREQMNDPMLRLFAFIDWIRKQGVFNNPVIAARYIPPKGPKP